MDINGNKVIAVDFDKTLSMAPYPEVGMPNEGLFAYLISEKEKGSLIILNSCRTGDNLRKAVEFCNENGLYFDAINDNVPSMIEKFGDNPRKISADVYIDDKAYSPFAIEDIYITKRDKPIDAAAKLTKLGLKELSEICDYLEIYLAVELQKCITERS